MLEGFEPTRYDVPAVPVAAVSLPALEPTRLSTPPPAAQAPTPGVVVCRHCRSPATREDVFCPGCGLRLGTWRPVAAPRAPEPVRCHVCSGEVIGPVCMKCGVRVEAG